MTYFVEGRMYRYPSETVLDIIENHYRLFGYCPDYLFGRRRKLTNLKGK